MKADDSRNVLAGAGQGAIGLRRLVAEKDAALRLGVSWRTLQAWRVRGGGPPFVRLGVAIRYDLATLDAWIDMNTRQSTSDLGPAAD